MGLGVWETVMRNELIANTVGVIVAFECLTRMVQLKERESKEKKPSVKTY